MGVALDKGFCDSTRGCIGELGGGGKSGYVLQGIQQLVLWGKGLGVGAGVFGYGLQGGVCSKQVSSSRRSSSSSSSMEETSVPEAARQLLHQDQQYTREYQVWQHPQELRDQEGSEMGPSGESLEHCSMGQCSLSTGSRFCFDRPKQAEGGSLMSAAEPAPVTCHMWQLIWYIKAVG